LEKPRRETSSSLRYNINPDITEVHQVFNALLISSIYVLDQDKALDFYVGKLGLEVNTDQDLGFMRWLTVNVPGDSRQILLEKPGAPALDVKTAEQVREMVSKGATGGHLFFTAVDCRKTYNELRAKGVEFTEEPTERPYGIDCGLRDPFGNHIRFSQPLPVATPVASATKGNR
jgi:catechol 2,3-dioxygenase-like lactoylglutathione lyase family enzyme